MDSSNFHTPRSGMSISSHINTIDSRGIPKHAQRTEEEILSDLESVSENESYLTVVYPSSHKPTSFEDFKAEISARPYRPKSHSYVESELDDSPVSAANRRREVEEELSPVQRVFGPTGIRRSNMDARMTAFFERRDALLSIYDHAHSRSQTDWAHSSEMTISRWNTLAKSPDLSGAPVCEFSGRSWFVVFSQYHSGSTTAARTPIQLQRSDPKCFYSEKGSLKYCWGAQDMDDTPGIFPTTPAEMYEHLFSRQPREFESTFMFRAPSALEPFSISRQPRTTQRFGRDALPISEAEQRSSFEVYRDQRDRILEFLTYLKSLLRLYCSSGNDTNKRFYWTNYTTILMFYINTVNQVALNDTNVPLFLRREQYRERFLSYYFPLLDPSQLSQLSPEERTKRLLNAMTMVGMACPDCGEIPGCRELCPTPKCFQLKKQAYEDDSSATKDEAVDSTKDTSKEASKASAKASASPDTVFDRGLIPREITR